MRTRSVLVAFSARVGRITAFARACSLYTSANSDSLIGGVGFLVVWVFVLVVGLRTVVEGSHYRCGNETDMGNMGSSLSIFGVSLLCAPPR